MNNNKSLEDIRKKFQNAADNIKDIEGAEKEYEVLQVLAEKDMTPEEMLNELNKIASNKDYPMSMENFLYDRFEELKELAELEKEKEELTEEFKEKHDYYEDVLRDRNFDYHVNVDSFEPDFDKDASYKTKDESIKTIQDNIDLLDDREKVFDEIRQSGDFVEDPPLVNEYKELDGLKVGNNQDPNFNIKELNEEYQDINDQAMNMKEYSNLTKEDMLALYNDAKSRENEDSALYADVAYDNDGSVKVTLYYEGTEINQDFPMTVCYFEDEQEFDDEILPMIEDRVKEKGIQRKRKPPFGSMDDAGYNNKAIYTIILVMIIVIIITIVFLKFFK